ncbi:MAG: putative ABC transporter permease, partial [Clostridia bacterium]|nr:putative ABC transporter permease [Clostridia bacterium]
HRVESRKGLVYGPFNLVYGFGGLWLTLALYPLRECSWIVVFIVGSIVGGIWEYLCSLFQEKVFGSVSWDYGEFYFNFHGRVTLLYSFFWGGLSLWWIKSAYPIMSSLVEMIPNRIGILFTWILLVFIVFDSVVSFFAVYRMNQRRKGEPARNSFMRWIDRYFTDARLEKIYPNMMFK